MKNIKRALIFLTTVVVLFASTIVFGADAPKVYFNDGFGAYITNTHSIEGYTISDSSKFIVDETNGRDKVAKFPKGSKLSMEMPFSETVAEKFIVSLETVFYEKTPSFKVDLIQGGAPIELYYVDNGALYIRNNNKNASFILPGKGKTTKIDAIIDANYGIVDIYINGKCKLKEWKISSISGKFAALKVTQTSEAAFGLSSVAVYEAVGDGAEAIDMKIKDNRFNPEIKSTFYLGKDESDYTYFHSDFICKSKLQYINTSFGVKAGNSYTAEALINWKNINRNDRIFLNKAADDTTYNDVFMDVNLSKKPAFFKNRNVPYKYWMVKGDVMLTDASTEGRLVQLRDKTSGTNQEFHLLLKKRAIYTSDNKKLSDDLDLNKYYHFECYIDLAAHVYDVYLDGKIIGQDLPVPDKVNTVSLYRCIIDKGNGSWVLNDWEVRGMTKRYGREVNENGEIVPVVNKTSQYPDNEVIRTYLADKIVFHGDGQLYYKGGEKIPFTKEAVYEDKELWIAPEDFNKAFGTNIKYNEAQKKYIDGDKIYEASSPRNNLYPAKELAIAYGWGAKNNSYGSMVITGPNPVELIETSDTDYKSWFDEIFYEGSDAKDGDIPSPTLRFTDAQEISNFVFYDRPDAEKIQQDFNKVMGENPGHPRLMLTGEDVTRLRNLRKTDAYFENMVQSLLNTVDSTDMNMQQIKYAGGKTEMGIGSDSEMAGDGQKFQDIERVALAYILTGDTKYSDKAIEHLMGVVDTFPDLNPNHIIDVGIWLKPISVIYDWCYDAMTEEQRARTAKFIAEKGLEVINRAYYAQLPTGEDLNGASFQNANWFATWKSNYISYIQGGVVPGALAVAEAYPEVAFDTLEKCMRAFEYEHYGFYPAGVWLEGKGYQDTINRYNAYAFGSMQTTLNTDYQILKYKGMHESLQFQMSNGSLIGSYTYSDDKLREYLGGVTDAYQFYANYYDDPVLSMWRQFKLKNEYSEKYGVSGQNAEVLDIIYYEPMAGEEVIENFDKVQYYEGGEFFNVHENWLDKNATFFATQGGPTYQYHRHYDAGDFYYAKDGVIWSYEFGPGNYGISNVRYRFGGRTEAHNTITINNSYEPSVNDRSFVPMIDMGKGEGGAYAVYDMKELYAHYGAEKMHRGFYIGDNYESLRVRDEMSFSKTVTGYWHFHTEANVRKIDDNTMLLSKDGKSILLHINIENNGDFETEFSVNKARPLPESPVLDGDGQASTDINQVRIKFAGKGDINITVEFFDSVRNIDLTPIAHWTAPKQ